MSKATNKPVPNSGCKLLIRKINAYPPYLGMRIRMAGTSEDFTRCVQRQYKLPLWWLAARSLA